MAMIRKHIPNIISLLNALFGAFAVFYALRYEDIGHAIICMLLAALMDFLDGFTARKLGAYSPLGKDIDSLCDVISFGVAPSAMLLVALQSIGFPISAIALIMVPASVYRLAKFNHDTRQTSSFIGLPTPANALFIAGLAYFTNTYADAISSAPLSITYKIFALYPLIIVAHSYLLISEMPMFSLKSSSGYTKTGYFIRLGVVGATTIIGLILWSFSGLAVGLGLYTLINLWDYLKDKIPE